MFCCTSSKLGYWYKNLENVHVSPKSVSKMGSVACCCVSDALRDKWKALPTGWFFVPGAVCLLLAVRQRRKPRCGGVHLLPSSRLAGALREKAAFKLDLCDLSIADEKQLALERELTVMPHCLLSCCQAYLRYVT